jgi:hypothetical protein
MMALWFAGDTPRQETLLPGMTPGLKLAVVQLWTGAWHQNRCWPCFNRPGAAAGRSSLTYVW